MSPTNLYFNNFNAKNEQNLVEDLMVEAIRMYGFEAYYIPIENPEDRDLIWGEDPLKRFEKVYPVELYMTNADGYVGEQEFFSKFGLEIRNNVNVLVSKRTFSQRIGTVLDRPMDGHLIWVPFTGASGRGELYEIKFVSGNKDYFVLGRATPYFYELELEKFKYSSEEINTGIAQIDDVVKYSYTITFNLDSGTGNYIQKEIAYQGTDLANATCQGTVTSWDAPTKVLDLINIIGNFSATANIRGNTSNSNYSVSNFEEVGSSDTYNVYDNLLIKTEATAILDLTENNPFGNNL